MRVAGKTVILVADAGGLGAAISAGLAVKPGSDLSRQQSTLKLSLEKYGVKDPEESCSLVEFIDRCGSSQVSIILLPNFQPPVAACAANEILASLMSNDSSDLPLILLPVLQKSLKINQEAKKQKLLDERTPIFGVGIGRENDTVHALLSGISRPPSFRMSCETSACLVQMIQVLRIPSLIIGTNFDQQGLSAKSSNLQEVSQIGEFLGNCTGLSFSTDGINWRDKEKSITQEPWQSLYG